MNVPTSTAQSSELDWLACVVSCCILWCGSHGSYALLGGLE